ncbi:MAG TPA: tRNA (adenosine(37)-N6)-dimethylallyltransferase MiaA [Gemmatimonadales bacterium]|nr:tRNA (adenosine(37)-N6)-dimethylallyltransferase MiaA [Gemmatimonadales bacterium]
MGTQRAGRSTAASRAAGSAPAAQAPAPGSVPAAPSAAAGASRAAPDALAPVLVITGPTGIGKSRVAAALARLAPIEIVSADSGQVYRYLNIGTAKPSPAEREALPHHGLDLVLPTERYSAGRFARDARGWIADIAARGRMPVVVGGTGFYLRALFEGLFAEPPLDPARRDRLRAVLTPLGAEGLARWAARLDRGFKGGGAQRAARAVEVALLAGRPLSELQRSGAPPVPGVSPWYAVLRLPRPQLAERIAERTRTMLASGLVDEVRRLLASNVPQDAPALELVGYREVVAFMYGATDEAGLAEAITTATRQFAKRQETWLRHQLKGPVAWFDAAEEPGALAEQMLARYRAATS